MSTVRLRKPSGGDDDAGSSGPATPGSFSLDALQGIKRPLNENAPASSLPNLKLGELLGRGASGSVYKALDTETGEVIAAKRIALGNIEELELPSIMSEIDLLRNLSHPNVVQYRGFAKTEDHLYIFTELCDGSLHSIGKRFGRFPESLVQHYVLQILTGLAYLHDEGCVHRDIKASNLLATKDGGVKLADFGVATRVGTQLGDALGSDAVVGSPYWMSPEVITQSQNGAPSSAADIWATGCTTIELLSGQPPYGNLDGMGALFRIVSDDCPPLPDSASPIVRDFLVQCLQKDPNLRISAKKLLKHPWMVNARKRIDQKLADPRRRIPLGDRSTNRVLPPAVEEMLKDWNKALKDDRPAEKPRPLTQARPPSRVHDAPARRRRSLEGVAGTLSSLAGAGPKEAQTAAAASSANLLAEKEAWDDDFCVSSAELQGQSKRTRVDESQRDQREPLGSEDGAAFAGRVAGYKLLNERSRFLRPADLAQVSERSDGGDGDQPVPGPQAGSPPALPKKHPRDFSEGGEDWSDMFDPARDSAMALVLNVPARRDVQELDECQSSDDDDPFAEVEEDQTEEASFEANVARDRHARLLGTVTELVGRMTTGAHEPSLHQDSLELIDLLEVTADAKHQFVRSHGMLATIELLQQSKRSTETAALLLRIVNIVISDSSESLEKLCVNGGCPVVMAFAAPSYPRQIRLEAALFIGAMCATSILTLQIFISCRGLASLVALMDQSYDEQKDLIYLAVQGINRVFDLQGPTPRNDFCRMFAHEGLLEPLSEALVRVNEDEDELAVNARRRISHILLLFSQADLSVKTSVLTRPIALRLVKALGSLEGDALGLLLKAVKNLSSAPSGLTCLQHAGAIEALTGILRKHAHLTSARSNDIANSVVNTLFNLCRLSKARQEEAALAGAIPALMTVVDRNSPLKQFALPILCDFAHTSKTCRKLLWQKDGFAFYVRLLQDPFFGVVALESLLAWLSDEATSIRDAANSPPALDALARLFIAARPGAIENLVDPFVRLFRLSAPVARHLMGRSAFVDRLLERLRASNKAAVRLNLLRLVRGAYDAFGPTAAVPAHHGLMVRAVGDLARSDPAVLVRELAKDLAAGLSTNANPSASGRSGSRPPPSMARVARHAPDRQDASRTVSPAPRVPGGMFERLVKKNAVSHRRASSRS